MNDKPDVTQLIESLIQKTQEGKIVWRPAGFVDRFAASVGGEFSVFIERFPDSYLLSIRDFKDREVTRVVGYLFPRDLYTDKLEHLWDVVTSGRTAAVERVLKVIENL